MSKDIIYLHELDTIKKNFEGIGYESNGLLRSIVTKDTVFKDLSGFGGDMELAYECLDIWKELGFSGAPSSPASFFRKMYHERGIIKASTNNIFRPFFHGGWQENFVKGSVLDTVYLYDIVKAYLWASKKGFPERIRPYCKGDKNFIGIVEMEKIRPEAPKYFRKKYCVATDFDIENYDLHCKIIKGYTYSDLNIKPFDFIMSLQDKMPGRAWKLLTQGYWGIWAQTNPLVIHKKDGSKRKQYNYFQNLINATLVVHRVMYRLWEKARINGVSVYVDSVLTTDKINEGERIGDFKLKKVFQKGIFIKSPGVYTGINEHGTNLSNWFRHSGYK